MVGAANCWNKGNSVFPIVFNTGQAEPLVIARFLCPRRSPGESAQEPRKVFHARPRTRPVHGHSQSAHRQRTRAVPVHGTTMSPFSPCPRKVHGHGRGLDHTDSKDVHATALAMDADCPRAGHCLEQSMSTALPRTTPIRVLDGASKCPDFGLRLATAWPLKGAALANIIPAYVHL